MSVTITKPASGATLKGLAVVEATYSGKNFEIATVSVDGQQIGSDSAKPIAFSIDTAKVADGQHTLTVAVRYRTAGGAQRWQKASIPITTEGNEMKVNLSTSGGSAGLSGSVTVTATVTPSQHAETPVSCKFSIDNGPVLATDTSYPLTFSWNTTTVTDGNHVIRAVVVAGTRTRSATGAMTVSVLNQPPPPPPPPPVQSPPVNTAVPTINDTTPQEGQTIAVFDGAWTNSPTSFTRQWRRCDAGGANCVAIPSATGVSYTCSAEDVDSTLRCSVTAHNAVGSSAPAQTAQTTAVSALAASVPVLVPGATPVISGSPVQGNALGISNGSWTNSPTSYARQWKRCQPSPVTSSINDGDTIVQGQVWTVLANPDATLVEFYADGSKLGEDTSEPFQITLNLSLAAHQLGIAITTANIPRTILTESDVGGAFAVVTCSAGPAVVTGAGDSIAGATAETYALATADVGKTIRCLTTASNATGASIPVQSEQTGVVASSAPPSPPPVLTPWPGYGYEISLVQYSSPPSPEVVYQPNGTITLTCRDATPLIGSDRQLVAAYLLSGAQAIEGRRCRYEWTQTFPSDWQGTEGEVNFFLEMHTQTGQGAGQLSCGIGARCDYPPSGPPRHDRPGVNPTWFFRPIGPGGSPPLNEMIGPPIVPGTSYNMKLEVLWGSTVGEFKVFINGAQLRNWSLPTFWSGDNLSLSLYNYRWDTPHTASVNFSKPVVTVL